MRGVLTGLLLAMVALCTGCLPVYVPEDRTDRRERVLKVETHVGGMHRRTIVSGGLWLQSFNQQLLVLDINDGRTISSLDIHPWGDGGPISDMAIDGDLLWVVTDRTSLAEVHLGDPTAPELGRVYTAAELGIEPRHVSLAGGEVWVCGEGGVVRMRDGKRFLTGDPVTRVVQTSAGPAASVRRRIVMVEDGRYLGAATELFPLPSGFGPEGGYLFVLQGNMRGQDTSAQVGLMTPAFGELASVAIRGIVRRARILGDHLVLVTDTEIEFWSLKGGKLVEPIRVPLKGGRDIDMVRPNLYAVSGSFGRAQYRLAPEGREPGDTFLQVQREPGLLELAVSDGRRVLAGGREGFWLWRIGGEAELTEKTTDLRQVLPERVDAAWGSAELRFEDPSGARIATAVEFKHDGVSTVYVPDGAPQIYSMVLIDNDVWIGHERGLDVVRRVPASATAASPQPSGSGQQIPVQAPFTMQAVSQFRFDGPVLFIFRESLSGGAAVISLHGGFALFRPVPVGEAPVFRGRGDVR